MDTKQKILEEALRLFSREGFEAVSVERIASAVGIKAPSLYKHYKSKQDIFASIVNRMDELDGQRAKKYGIPESESFEELAAEYGKTPLEKIRTYTEAQFRHWTEEPFSSDFRRMLTIEQYKSAQMAQLFQKYLAGGPLSYITELFTGMTGDHCNAELLALSFYSPIFMLYSLYDGAENKTQVFRLLRAHTESFTQNVRIG